jgi:hypothetical protein
VALEKLKENAACFMSESEAGDIIPKRVPGKEPVP